MAALTSRNKIGNVRMTLTLWRVRMTTAAVRKQHEFGVNFFHVIAYTT